jgi:hypothetical protein
MKRTHGVFGAVFLLASIVGVTTFPTAAASETTEEVLRLKARMTEASFLDLGVAGPSLGDQFIFHDVLKLDGERIGRSGGVCTLTSTSTGAEGEFNCLVTLWLPDGQIATQALVTQTGETPESTSPSPAAPAVLKKRTVRST